MQKQPDKISWLGSSQCLPRATSTHEGSRAATAPSVEHWPGLDVLPELCIRGTVKLGFNIAIGKTAISDAAVNRHAIKFSLM